MEGFKSTSIDRILEDMPYREMCIVKKGLFPTTVKGLESEEYAFVSIDVDFETSILEAIFLHVYNNRFLEGVKRAIDLYEDEMGMSMIKVPLADEGGTLVIVK